MSGGRHPPGIVQQTTERVPMFCEESAVSAARAVEIENKDAEGVLASGQIGQAYFGAVGQAVHDMGWAVYPQEREGRRMPSMIDGEVVKWSLYQKERVDQDTLDKWLTQARHANLAVVMGPSSSNALVIDIDVTDEDRSYQAEALTERVLGKTRFKRVGSHPKIMLFYRLAGEASFTKRTFRLSEAGDATQASPHTVEILAKQCSATFYGRHHVTGGAFRWFKPPTRHSPLELPLITEEQLAEFEVELDKLLSIYKPTSSIGADEFGGVEAVESSGVKITRMRHGLVRNADGLVEDGREELLSNLVWDQLASNAFVDRPTRFTDDQIAACRAAIAEKVFRHFAKSAGGTINWSNEAEVRRQIGTRVRHAAPKFAATARGYSERRLIADPAKLLEIPAHAWDRAPDSPLAFLSSKAFRPRLQDRAGFELAAAREGEAAIDHSEAAIADRMTQWRLKNEVEQRETSALASAKIEEVATAYFYACLRGDKAAAEKILWVLQAATGSGKTSTVGRVLMELIEKHEAELGEDDVFLFVVPSHANADGLVAELQRAGFPVVYPRTQIGVDDHGKPVMVPTPIPTARPARPQAGVREGKERAGCIFGEVMTALEEAEMLSGRLCSTYDEEVGPRESDVECAIRKANLCAHYRQTELNRFLRLIILPRAYLTAPMPACISKRNILGKICDEDPLFSLLRDYRLPIASMLATREGEQVVLKAQGRVKRGEKRKEIRLAPDYVADIRKRLMRLVIDALVAGEGPARRVRFQKEIVDGLLWDPRLLLRAAKACCRRSAAKALEVRPYQGDANDPAAIARFTAAVEEKHGRKLKIETGVVAERALLTILTEILKRDPTLHQDGPDHRLQLRAEGEDEKLTHVRIARRLEPNLCGDYPVLLLDASAQEPVVEKVFGRKPKMIPVPTSLRLLIAACFDRTFSASSILPRKDDTPEIRQKRLDLRRYIRLAITALAFHYREGRVLIVATKKVRAWLNRRDWGAPENVDFMHYGALRGLDWAKEHNALLTIGQSELPADVNDAYASALAHDDVDPWVPVDDGRGGDVQHEEEMRHLRLRNGWLLQRRVRVMPAGRSRQVATAWREEELRQAAGRLRPIHRTGQAPVWIVMGTAIAEDFVVDEVFRFSDFVATSGPAEKARVAGDMVAVKNIEVDNSLRDEEPLPDYATRLRLEKKLDRVRKEFGSRYDPDEGLFALDLLDWRREFYSYFGVPDEAIALLGTKAECARIDWILQIDSKIMDQMEFLGIQSMRPTREEALAI